MFWFRSCLLLVDLGGQNSSLLSELPAVQPFSDSSKMLVGFRTFDLVGWTSSIFDYRNNCELFYFVELSDHFSLGKEDYLQIIEAYETEL